MAKRNTNNDFVIKEEEKNGTPAKDNQKSDDKDSTENAQLNIVEEGSKATEVKSETEKNDSPEFTITESENNSPQPDVAPTQDETQDIINDFENVNGEENNSKSEAQATAENASDSENLKSDVECAAQDDSINFEDVKSEAEDNMDINDVTPVDSVEKQPENSTDSNESTDSHSQQLGAPDDLIFCGSSPAFLKEELTRFSNDENGGTAFRIPSLINADGTLIAAIDRQSCGADWGYIEVAIRRSEDKGKTWSPVESIAVPPARETMKNADCYKSGFFIDPCMAIAPNGDVIMLVDFFPECKGIHNKSLLDKKKMPFGMINSKMHQLIYDREGKFFYVLDDGNVLDNQRQPTDYKVTDGKGSLYKGDEYIGNIYLNGKTGANEENAKITFGAPLKAPKRCYIFMLKSSDKGKTWSEPKDITNMVLSDKDGIFLGVAPGTGITTDDGRIVMPLYVDRKETVSIYSIDNGETWHRTPSHPYAKNIDEWQIVSAPDGTLIGIGRQKSYGKSPMSVSTDSGKSWIKVKPTKLYAPKCQKSVIAQGRYVFCSHPSEHSRENGVLTVGKMRKSKGVFDTIEWRSEVEINKGFFAYSSLTFIDEDTIGVLYEDEPSSYIKFKAFKIDDIK